MLLPTPPRSLSVAILAISIVAPIIVVVYLAARSCVLELSLQRFRWLAEEAFDLRLIHNLGSSESRLAKIDVEVLMASKALGDRSTRLADLLHDLKRFCSRCARAQPLSGGFCSYAFPSESLTLKPSAACSCGRPDELSPPRVLVLLCDVTSESRRCTMSMSLSAEVPRPAATPPPEGVMPPSVCLPFMMCLRSPRAVW
eukprot:937021-Prymnesium_polylepis.1